MLAAVVLGSAGGCASARIGRAVHDMDGPYAWSCWIHRDAASNPGGDEQDCQDAAAARDESRCTDELTSRRPRLWWYEETRAAHLACMSEKGWTRLQYMVLTM